MKVKVALLYLLSATLLTLSCKTTRKDTGDSMAPPAAAPGPAPIVNSTTPQGGGGCPTMNFALAEFPAVNPSAIKAVTPRLGMLSTGNTTVGYSNQVTLNFGYVCPESDPFCSNNEALKADYGTYKVCPFDMNTSKLKEGACVSGTSYWSVNVPDLNALLAASPTLMVIVRACVNKNRIKGGAGACGPESQSVISIEKSTNTDLVDLDKNLHAINQKIQDLFISSDLSKSATTYLKSLEGKTTLSASQVELKNVAENILHHPHLAAGNMQDRLLVNQIVKNTAGGSTGNTGFNLTETGATCPGFAPPKSDSTDVAGILQDQLTQSKKNAAILAAQVKELQANQDSTGGDTNEKLATALAAQADAEKKRASLATQVKELQASQDSGSADASAKLATALAAQADAEKKSANLADQVKALQNRDLNGEVAAALAAQADAEKKSALLQAQLDALQNPTIPEPDASLQSLKNADDILFAAALEAKQVADRAKHPDAHADELFTKAETRTTGLITEKERKKIVTAKILAATDAENLSDAALNAAKEKVAKNAGVDSYATLMAAGKPMGKYETAIMQEELRRTQALAWIDDAESVETKKESSTQLVDWSMSESSAKKTRGAFVIIGGLVGAGVILGGANHYLDQDGRFDTKNGLEYGSKTAYSIEKGSFGEYTIKFGDNTSLNTKATSLTSYIEGKNVPAKIITGTEYTVELKGTNYTISAGNIEVARIQQDNFGKYFDLKADNKATAKLTIDIDQNIHYKMSAAGMMQYAEGIELAADSTKSTKLKYDPKTVTLSPRNKFAAKAIGVGAIVGAVATVSAGIAMLNLTADAADAAATDFMANLDKAGAQVVTWNLKKQDIETQQGKILDQ